MPFGLGLADWDVLLTDEQLAVFFKQLAVINTSTSTVMALAMVVHWTDAPRVKIAMEANGYNDVHPVYVYKPSQNQKGMECYIFAVEVVLVGYMADRRSRKLFFRDPNPVRRHNLKFSHNVGTKATVPGSSEVVNTTQKHPDLAEQLARDLCPVGSSVLVLGSGSGSDVIGFARAGLRVVAVESDKKQFLACQARLVDVASDQRGRHESTHAVEQQQLAALGERVASFSSWAPAASSVAPSGACTSPSTSTSSSSSSSTTANTSRGSSAQGSCVCAPCGAQVTDSTERVLCCALIECQVKGIHRACLEECQEDEECGMLFCSDECRKKHITDVHISMPPTSK